MITRPITELWKSECVRLLHLNRTNVSYYNLLKIKYINNILNRIFQLVI